MVRYEDEALLDMAWLSVEKLEFKILVMASVLALDNKAFLGTLQDIEQYLGIASNRKNNGKINVALSSLSRQGYIKVYHDKENIIIALSYDARNDNKVIYIQRAWVQIIRDYKPEKKDCVAWETILRTFLYLLGNWNKGIFTYERIGNELGLKPATISKAVKALCNMDFRNMRVEKRAIKDNIDDRYYTIGSEYSIMLNFEGVRIDATNHDN